MLPNYEAEIAPARKANGGYFHWIPQELTEALDIDRTNFCNIMNSFLNKRGVVVTEGRSDRFNEYPEFLVKDQSEPKDIRFVAIDEEAKNFYAMYGALSAKDLEGYQSCEVDSLEFLREIKEDEKVKKNPQALKNLDSMIRKEERRRGMDVEQINVEVVDVISCRPHNVFGYFRSCLNLLLNSRQQNQQSHRNGSNQNIQL